MSDTEEPSARLEDLENKLVSLDMKVDNLLEVCAAVSDDTLRMCFALDELHKAGALPKVPWDVATSLVELQHAMQAAKEDSQDDAGVAAAQRVGELKREVLELRKAYHQSLVAEPVNGDGDDSQPT